MTERSVLSFELFPSFKKLYSAFRNFDCVCMCLSVYLRFCLSNGLTDCLHISHECYLFLGQAMYVYDLFIFFIVITLKIKNGSRTVSPSLSLSPDASFWLNRMSNLVTNNIL